jgi:serpin B
MGVGGDHPVFAGSQADLEAVVGGNSAFALDLYKTLRKSDGNLFLSPHSISTALAMTYAGARGDTETQMAATLHFALEQSRLHPAIAELEAKLGRKGRDSHVTLCMANSLWPDKHYTLLPEYLSLVERYYGASITPVGYRGSAEKARLKINRWVEENTRGKITDMIKPGLLDALTRLVLVNAIYFKGHWAEKFNPDFTRDQAFFVLPGKPVQVPMMLGRSEMFNYAEFESFQILEMPYEGNNLAMLILLPMEIDGITALERRLSLKNLTEWRRRMSARLVEVSFPKFKMTSGFLMKDTLESMGMTNAFDGEKADFAGMHGESDEPLYIADVVHKAFVEVNEEGTEAAAATAVVHTRDSGPPALRPVTFVADHPFLFLILDKGSGNILFMGRMADPKTVASSSSMRGIAGVRQGQASDVVQQVEQGYGQGYAGNVNTFFTAMQTPGSSSSSSSGEALEVAFDVVREAPGEYQPETVWDGDTLTHQDNYKVVFQSNTPCYIYIAQVDSTGKVNAIFPSSYASGGNPVQVSTPYEVPTGPGWFYLDDNVGVETIYVMASREQRRDLEDIFAQFEYRNQNLVPQQQVQMNQYYSLNRGVGWVRQGGATQEVRYQDGTQGQYQATVFSSVQAEFVATRWFYHQ